MAKLAWNRLSACLGGRRFLLELYFAYSTTANPILILKFLQQVLQYFSLICILYQLEYVDMQIIDTGFMYIIIAIIS